MTALAVQRRILLCLHLGLVGCVEGGTWLVSDLADIVFHGYRRVLRSNTTGLTGFVPRFAPDELHPTTCFGEHSSPSTRSLSALAIS